MKLFVRSVRRQHPFSDTPRGVPLLRSDLCTRPRSWRSRFELRIAQLGVANPAMWPASCQSDRISKFGHWAHANCSAPHYKVPRFLFNTKVLPNWAEGYRGNWSAHSTNQRAFLPNIPFSRVSQRFPRSEDGGMETPKVSPTHAADHGDYIFVRYAVCFGRPPTQLTVTHPELNCYRGVLGSSYSKFIGRV